MSLVERNAEVAVLHGLFGDCLEARSRLAIISGDVATGKSSLLDAFERQAAESGAVVLNAVASSVETALPMGVLEQLFRSPEVPEAIAERAMKLLNARALTYPMRFRGLWDVLRDLTERRPVVISVDDVHHADEISLQCLLYLLRRLRSARLLTVLTVSPRSQAPNAPFQSEFLREPHSRQIRLGPLSPDGVEALIRLDLDAQTARLLAPAFHEASAGNPALVHALVDDYLAGPEFIAPELVAGGAFGRAVVGLLQRHEFPVLEVARAIGILNEPVPPSLIGRLLDIDAETAARAVGTLTSAGILDAGSFRHGAAQAAVVDSAPPDAPGVLHERAAEQLHSDGAAATDVAAHIVASNRHGAPWAIPVLREAAEQALTSDDLGTGIRYLRVAHQICRDRRERSAIAARLADLEWRVDPSVALRWVPEFSLAIQDGLLDGRDAGTPFMSLLWHGRVSEAVRMLDALGRGRPSAALPGDAGTAMDVIPRGSAWPTCIPSWRRTARRRTPPPPSARSRRRRPVPGRTRRRCSWPSCTAGTCAGRWSRRSGSWNAPA
ncbi:AAA family ATPase [Actinomadura yumaensis]|uniref:AAA family ATPase n=1 Tax=Actinomadura yumaensis TaxID=111807 RepID=UPI003618C444